MSKESKIILGINIGLLVLYLIYYFNNIFIVIGTIPIGIVFGMMIERYISKDLRNLQNREIELLSRMLELREVDDD